MRYLIILKALNEKSCKNIRLIQFLRNKETLLIVKTRNNRKDLANMTEITTKTFIELDIKNLNLDRNNPRIKSILEMYASTIDDEKIKLALITNTHATDSGGTTYYSLKESIRTNGGIIHPIIVNYETKENKYVVVEGNTRVQIYRELAVDMVNGNWGKIPSIVYTDLEEQTINAIRLQAHLVGPRDWDPYSKAKYLHSLYNDQCLSFNQIVDFCGGNKSDVSEYIEAYKVMEENYRPLLDSDSDFEKNKFSAFREVLRTSIKESLFRNNYTLKDFAKWVIDNKFKPLSEVRELPGILANPKACQEFLKEGKSVKDARKFMMISADGINVDKIPLEILLNESIRKIKMLPFEEYIQIKDGSDPQRYSLIVDLFEQLSNLYMEISESNNG